MDFIELLDETMKKNASDLHLTVGVPPINRINGRLIPMETEKLDQKTMERYVKTILDEEQYDSYRKKGEIDLSYSVSGIGRFRVNIYRQRGSDAMALRAVGLKVPTLEELNHPPILAEFSRRNRGLILVTGPTGSGKSTTLAAMINQINSERNCHILTLEDPVEFLHKHGKSMVNQREIGHDTLNYANALKSALREDPDVILVGEMRDLETISTAITAAETGH